MMKDRSRRLGGCVPKAVPSHSSPHRLKEGWEPGQGEQRGEKGRRWICSGRVVLSICTNGEKELPLQSRGSGG